jgi:AraC-like DNA-binding protein
MLTEYSLDGVAPTEGARFWTGVVTSVYFSQSANPNDPLGFSGSLRNWNLGDVSLSRIESGPICYQRSPAHLRGDKDEHMLITFAGRSEIRFEQDRMSLACRKNQFFIEMAHLPYVFAQLEQNEVWVLRVPTSLLKWHVGSIEKFAPYVFDAGCGIGALLFDMMRMAPCRLQEADRVNHSRVGQSLVELLALALEGDDRVLQSTQSPIGTAHLARIERFIRQNLNNADLSPEFIANSCGISTRYLHWLFRASGSSVSRWIREQRLIACDRDLRRSDRRKSIAAVAYHWGFNDHAQFSRQFKAYYGRTPTDSREAGRDVASHAALTDTESD